LKSKYNPMKNNNTNNQQKKKKNGGAGQAAARTARAVSAPARRVARAAGGLDMRSLMRGAIGIGAEIAPFPYNLAARAFQKVTGMGDYDVKSNTLARNGIRGSAVTTVPQFDSNNSHRVCHRECLGTVISPGTAFTVLKKMTFNPSNSVTFPWLSSVAPNFVMWKLHGAVVVFESNTSEYSSTSGMGTVCLATRYDSRETNYTSMLEMQNSQFACSAKPSLSLVHPIECDPATAVNDVWYVRRGNETQTIYNYDKCITSLAVEGLSATAGTVIGRLWITYDLEFFSPALPPMVGLSTATQLYYQTWTANTNKGISNIWGTMTPVGSSAGFTNTQPLTYPMTAYVWNDSTNKQVRIYKSGYLAINWTGSGTGLTANGQTFIALSNIGTASAFGGQGQQQTAGSTTNFTYWAYYYVTIPSSPEDLASYALLTFTDLTATTVTGQSLSVSFSPTAPLLGA